MMNEGWRSLRGHRADLILALTIFALIAIGLIMMYSISPILSQSLTGSINRNYYFYNQLRSVAIGLVVWLVATNIPYRHWYGLAKLGLMLASASLLLLITPLANSRLGATRWVAIGPFSFQPAELLKLALIIYLAVWLDGRRPKLQDFKTAVLPFTLIIGVACIVIIGFQRDLGTAAVLGLAATGMYVVAGLHWRHLAFLAGIGVLMVAIAIIFAPHRIARLTTFLDSSSNQSGAGYQEHQALIAIGSGGILGLGLGKSVQVNGYLPEAANDSIFAVMGEEFGLIGALVILGLYGLLVYRGLMVARHAPDGYATYLAAGITLWFGFQALINIGAMVSLVPLTGIPLPYISYGGTNLIVSLAGAGILLNISRYTSSQEDYASTSQRRGDGRSRIADSRYRRRAPIAG